MCVSSDCSVASRSRSLRRCVCVFTNGLVWLALAVGRVAALQEDEWHASPANAVCISHGWCTSLSLFAAKKQQQWTLSRRRNAVSCSSILSASTARVRYDVVLMRIEGSRERNGSFSIYLSTAVIAMTTTEPFRERVNWEEWGLYDYLQVVKVPMDLGTIRSKLAKNEYKKAAEFARDVRLVWDNCKLYNQVADGRTTVVRILYGNEGSTDRWTACVYVSVYRTDRSSTTLPMVSRSALRTA